MIGLAAVVVVSVALVAALLRTDSTEGQASPAPGAGGSASVESSRPAGSPTSAEPIGSLEDTDPCSLITVSEVEQAMGPLREAPKVEQIGSARVCESAPNRDYLAVGIRTNVGLAGVLPNGGEIKDITVGRHQAKQLLGASGSCGIYLGVTASSRVDVVVNVGASTDPCPPALRIAELVEPKLP
ncbi:MAG: DUF3558 domain-containing protein [Saccharothrix sp.]|nr:DUF3558 domain-containing protein [Saccharothrix sp.]